MADDRQSVDKQGDDEYVGVVYHPTVVRGCTHPGNENREDGVQLSADDYTRLKPVEDGYYSVRYSRIRQNVTSDPQTGSSQIQVSNFQIFISLEALSVMTKTLSHIVRPVFTFQPFLRFCSTFPHFS